ncbi:MAG: 30S ribosomal protein S1 [Candidatus Nitrospinota bacterium M3_3B_026]
MTGSDKSAISRVREDDYVTGDFEEPLDQEEIAPSSGDISADEFEKLVNENMGEFREGETITGRIVDKTPNHVVVDVGFKSEGLIPIQEFGVEAESLEVGDEVEVYLESAEDSDGMLVLSKEKANKIRVWEEIAEKYEKNEVVEGVVTSKIKGGLTVDIGLKAFLPGSQIDLRPIKHLDKLIGERFEFRIIKMNKKRGNIVLSRRVLLEEERKITKEATLSKLEEGKIIEGVVKNITEYGAFIDLGGIDGLLHITDMSWGRVSHPSEMFSIGDTVKVMVLKFDKETERVSLGYKQTTPDPWENAEEKYKPGSRVKGRVVSLADYGAFVELEEGVEGLVHISEMSWNKHIRHPAKLVNIGDEVEAVVLSIDIERKRISLGIKQTEPNPWDNIEEKYPVNSAVEGVVRNLADFGAFVELEEGVDGLIHISDMSWSQKIKHPSEVLKKRDKVKCVVLSVDRESERVSLGLKQLEQDPWENVEERYPVGEEVKCVIVKVTNFGAFAEIEGGIEGLIHVSQLSTNRVANPRKAVRVGQEVTAKVIKVDLQNRKIGLSIKAFLEGLSPEDVEKELKAMEEAAAQVDEEEEETKGEEDGDSQPEEQEQEAESQTQAEDNQD